MVADQIANNELDKLLRNSLASNDTFRIPSGLEDRTIRKLEKRILLRELILELIFKGIVVIGSIIVLAVVFILINDRDLLKSIYAHFLSKWQIYTSVLFLIFITILIDQVVLRFYNRVRKEVSLKV